VLGWNFETGERRAWAYRPPTGFACAGAAGANSEDPETVRTIAQAFLEFRVDRAGQDLAGILTSSGEEQYATGSSDLPPLFSDYTHGEILYVDGPLAPGSEASPTAAAGASFEVGLRLFDGGEGAVEETLFLSGPEQVLSGDICPLAVSGARGGITDRDA